MCDQGSLHHVLKKDQWKQMENNHKSGKQTLKKNPPRNLSRDGPSTAG